jgi:hypothetical protein
MWRGSTISPRVRTSALVAFAAVLALVVAGNGGAAGTNGLVGPEGPPLEHGRALAPAAAPSPGSTVDGIECQSSEQVLFHIHARLTIYVSGRSRSVPYGIGIADPQTTPTPAGRFVTAGSCFAWLHTHVADGIIHIESPLRRTYLLGNFFDIWKQSLSATRVGPAHGPVVAFVNGKRWRGNPRNIPLHAHTQVQLDVGRPVVAPVHISNWNGL